MIENTHFGFASVAGVAIIAVMATLTIRNLDDGLKTRLRVRAAERGRSMEEEARRILDAALMDADAQPGTVATRIRRLFEPLGGVDLDIDALRREPMRAPPSFDE